MKKLLLLLSLSCSVGSHLLPAEGIARNIAQAFAENPLTVNIKPDLSGLTEGAGDAAGHIAKQIVQNLIEGGFEGFEGATKGSKMHGHAKRGLENLTQDITRAVADALSNPQLKKELEAAGSEWASMIGTTTKGARIGLEKDVYPELQQISQGAIGSFFNIRNTLQFSLPITGGFVLILAGIYGSRVFWNALEKRLLNPKPAILLAGSKYGRTDRLNRWLANYQTPPMIFDASVKERLEEIQEKTKNIRDHISAGQKITYDNLLLYGSSGTGKTLFAQRLADKTDMNFLRVTAASLLKSGVEGIKYFDELITMANKSTYGTIIFVDEADALFVNRDILSPDSDHYKVLNHILAVTGSGSNKWMLVAATNHAYVMDPAMGRRFQDRVLMPLPDENTRRELLNIYMDEQLFNTKNRSSQFISAAHSIITPEKIDSIIQSTAGLSHAEIEDMISIMGKKANATKDGMITQRNVDSAVIEAIEKKKALENDRIELEKKNTVIHPQAAPQIISDQEGIAAQAA